MWECLTCSQYQDDLPVSSERGIDFLPQVRADGLHCPNCQGVMELKISREMCGPWNKCRYDTECDVCGEQILWDAARHRCKSCNCDVCTRCAEQLQSGTMPLPGRSGGYGQPGVPPIEMGDVIFAGPDGWGIHHIILVTGWLEHSPHFNGEVGAHPHAEVYCFECIESTSHDSGPDSAWVPTLKLCYVDPNTREIYCQGEIVEGTKFLGYFDPPRQLKVLQQPFRFNASELPFDHNLFLEAVNDQKINSKKWSLATAVQALVADRTNRESYHIEKYEDDPEARALLLEKIERSWTRKPICSSVAIAVWQCYLLSAWTAAAPGPEGEDKAVEDILRWIPLICGRAAPYDLMKTLSKCGWQLVTHC
eukprot:gnl/MRDRNA2_/MRDRNA2_86121_c0_seq2.p1 gnl/MRDRNA2_/MRDRNA2_86121_c0~~gnl/MRDRNA2_/MRDRNA2_86121_c0_seq2.p1  ORF type:complete len:364 (+),score=48.65 gnl/MRDRNA2_/MRDRNA2_86121_c0_seq2:514-1605(+)